jgi:hypothetical protein
MPCRHIDEKTRPLVDVDIQKPLQIEKRNISKYLYYMFELSSCNSLELVVLIQIRFTTSPPTTIKWHMHYILNEVYKSNSVKSTLELGNLFADNIMPSKDTF